MPRRSDEKAPADPSERSALARAARGKRTVRILVPEAENLQLLAFWVAHFGGEFEAEGLRMELVYPESPARTPELMATDPAEVYALAAPLLLDAVAAGVRTGASYRLVASLLTSDPINLLVGASLAPQRPGADGGKPPLRDRLLYLRGKRIGVAPGPRPRLRAMFEEAGLDADRDVTVVVVPGKLQNEALRKGEVDALFAHTPFAETAIVDDGAALLVHASAVEVPALANRTVHGIVVTARFFEAENGTCSAIHRAIQRAVTRIRADAEGASKLLIDGFPTLPTARARTLVTLYRDAVPLDATPTVPELRAALTLYPETKAAPDLPDGVLMTLVPSREFFAAAKGALASDVRSGDGETAGAVTASRREGRLSWAAIVVSAVVGALLWLRLRRPTGSRQAAKPLGSWIPRE